MKRNINLLLRKMISMIRQKSQDCLKLGRKGEINFCAQQQWKIHVTKASILLLKIVLAHKYNLCANQLSIGATYNCIESTSREKRGKKKNPSTFKACVLDNQKHNITGWDQRKQTCIACPVPRTGTSWNFPCIWPIVRDLSPHGGKNFNAIFETTIITGITTFVIFTETIILNKSRA